ncbi:MAG: ATP-binding protein [Elusimicrobiota bacterium]
MGNINKKYNIGYRQKLLLSITIISTMTFVMLTVNRMNILKELMSERIINRVTSLGNLLAEQIKDDLVGNEITDLRETIELADQQSRISFVLVVDNGGKIMFSSQKEKEGEINKYIDSDNVEVSKDTYIKSFPLKKKKEEIGLVQIGFSLKELSDDLTSSLKESLIIICIGLFMIVLGSWYISEKLLSPLNQISKVTKKFAKGDFSETFTIKTRDVIGNLQESLNDMAEQLDDLNKNMQSKVDNATEKYETANKDLIEKTIILEETNKKLLELDSLKSDFVSMVSHELRTPLTGIIGFAGTLQKLKLSEEQKEKYLKIIESEGKRLGKLVEDFLDISKIESGNIELHFKRTDIRNIIKEVIESFDNVDMNMSETEQIVQADPDKIKQVLINLLSNAVKYTTGEDKIIVSAEEIEDKRIQISIKDMGPGIKKEDLSKIFDKFYRCDDDISKKNRGSGLGLAISKEIVRLHNGKIWAESDYGHGSLFNIILPKAKL